MEIRISSFVCTHPGWTFYVEAYTLVSKLKKMIEAEGGPPARQVTLVWKSKLLEDSKPLSAYPLDNSEAVELFLRLPTLKKLGDP